MNTQRILEIRSIERILLLLKTEPEECLQPLDVGVNCSGVVTPRDTLEQEKPSGFFNQSLCTRLTHV
jgi:hypothetical protein